MKRILKNSFLIALFFTPAFALAQDTTKLQDDFDSLLGLLDSNQFTDHNKYATATFKTTRIANGHSIENTKEGVLDFRINHRFGYINNGIREFFGLDNAITRIGFDYGIFNSLMIGVGRSTHLKEYDGFIKGKILKQTVTNTMPISLSYFGSLSVLSLQFQAPPGYGYQFSYRIAYINQLLIARKFSNSFSIQLMPAHIHYNFVQFSNEPNDIFALGIGGRVKISNRVSVTGEYYPVIGNRRHNTRNSLTLGVDIETGGHVFQLMFSNSTGITERTVIGETMGNWANGDIHFGFNISRVFTIVKPKEFRN